MNFEAEDVVELALQVFWELGDASPEPGQAIEELGLVVAARRVGFQLVEFRQLRSSLGLQCCESVPQPTAELFVEAVSIAAAGRGFLGLIEEPALAAADLLKPGSDRFAARFPFLGCPFVGPRQVRLQKRPALLAEDAAGEEVVDRFQQEVLPDSDDGRVVGEAVFASLVVAVGLAGEVDAGRPAALLGLTPHAATAQRAVHIGPQRVRAPGLRALVRGGSPPGTFASP